MFAYQVVELSGYFSAGCDVEKEGQSVRKTKTAKTDKPATPQSS